MSRIILREYNREEPHIVVGYDKPCASYFWQEFNKEPEVIEDQGGFRVMSNGSMSPVYKTRKEAEGHKWDDESWEEMKRFAGYMPNEMPTMASFLQSLPPDLAPMVDEDVQHLLNEHSMDPDCGRIMVRMVPTSFKVEVQTFGETKWSSNAIRFATHEEADKAGADLAHRWTMLENWRVSPSQDPVNYKWEDGKAVSV